jgi:signal transduction histidine kinase
MPMSTRRRLSQLLIASHMGLVILFALILGVIGVSSLRSAVQSQARVEVEKVAQLAQRRMQERERELSVTADLLAKQPTLRFYLQRGQRTKARTLISEFHKTSGVDYLRVQINQRTFAEYGDPPPSYEPGLVFDTRRRAWRVVSKTIPNLSNVTIVIAEPMTAQLNDISADGDILVALHSVRMGVTPPKAVWNQLLGRVISSGEAETAENIVGSAAARVIVLRDVNEIPEAVISVRAGDEWVTRRILGWLGVFGLAIVLTGALAMGLAAVLARRIARPFSELANEARRLGAGDLHTPITIPETFLSEPTALGLSLESMRQQVDILTMAERHQREELDAILNGVDAGVLGLDEDQRIHYANRQFFDLVELDRDAVIGQKLDEVIMPLQRQSIFSDQEGAIALAAVQRYTPIGKNRPLTLRRLEAGNNRQILIVREENAAEAAREMRDRILANLSHEFQTPLSAQIASIEMLRDHLRQNPDAIAMQLTDAQYRGTLRLSQLVENLLESVRIESGEMRLRNELVDIANIIQDAVELMQPLIEQREQKIVADISEGPMLMGDSQRLFSVLVNLLANANKFSPSQTTIWVNTEWAANEVTVWVEDEGRGLPIDSGQSDIFAPFKRSPHEEPSQRGTGLGLAIVYAVVTAHGGSVRVAPPQKRQGARIGVVLPIKEQA